LLAAPGRLTLYKSGSGDVEHAGGDAALRFRLDGGGFLRSKYFGEDAYAPDFAADPAAAGLAAPASAVPGAYSSFLTDFAKANLLRPIPFTAEDAALTLSLLEEQRRAGLGDDVYAPMKAALEDFLRRAGRAPASADAAADHGDPFAAIVPKVSRKVLESELSGAPVGKTARRRLGSGTEAYRGIDAVGEMTSAGARFYAEKFFDSREVADKNLAALALARRLKGEKLLGGLDVAAVVSDAADATAVKLSLEDGLDVGLIIREQALNSAYPEIVADYRRRLGAAAAALKSGGWDAELSKDGSSLYVYGPADASGRKKLAVQFIPQNIIATPDGRFVMVDPF
jgi:hypothetical protein